jgi:hypothetical protein
LKEKDIKFDENIDSNISDDAYDVVEFDTPKLVELELNSGPAYFYSSGNISNISNSNRKNLRFFA